MLDAVESAIALAYISMSVESTRRARQRAFVFDNQWSNQDEKRSALPPCDLTIIYSMFDLVS